MRDCPGDRHAMIKKVDTLHPQSETVAPNGFFESYARFFNEVLVQDEFRTDPLRHLYVFDRHQYAEPRFYPARGWEEVSSISDPELESEFAIDENFGGMEKELLSFLLVRRLSKVLKIVGDIGVGKSTFLQYMLECYLPRQKFFEHGIYIPINMIKIFRDRTEYSYSEVIQLLEEWFPDLYRQHAVAGDNILPDCPSGWKQLLRFLHQLVSARGENRVILAFDNVDAFPPDFQMCLWDVTQQLAECSGATCIVAMRKVNSRYFESLDRMPGTAYYLMEQRPPVVSRVVQRRMLYFLYRDDEIRKRRRICVQARDYNIEFGDLEEFVKKFVDILLDKTAADFLENLTNFNVRVAMRWTLRLLQSWNLNVVRMVTSLINALGHQRYTDPLVTFDTLVNALGLNNHSVYFPSESCLENIFSAGLKDTSTDLLVKYRILKYCDAQDWPVRKKALLSHLAVFGYGTRECQPALDQLMAHPRRLIRSDDGESFDSLRTIELNPAGRYYLARLIHYMDYLQLVMYDCYLPDALVDALDRQSTLPSRIASVVGFVEFIGDTELSEICRGIKRLGVRFRQDYSGVYGDDLLAARILANLEREVKLIYRAVRSGDDAHNSSVEICSLVQAAMDRLHRRYQEVMDR